MFERYTEKARRVIFFARYEASNFGSPYIETEHLLLGLLREDRTLANNYFNSHEAVDSVRRTIEQKTPAREKTSTSVDLPLSRDAKHVLAFAAEESQRVGHKHIHTIHLLIGLLRLEKGVATEILRERGVEISTVREELERERAEQTPQDELATEMQAEIHRQARNRGVKTREYLRSLLERALHARPVLPSDRPSRERLKETYGQLRERMAADGLPFLDEAELAQEIARRKGAGPGL